MEASPLGVADTTCDVVARPGLSAVLMLTRVTRLNIPKLQPAGRVCKGLPSSHEAAAASRWPYCLQAEGSKCPLPSRGIAPTFQGTSHVSGSPWSKYPGPDSLIRHPLPVLADARSTTHPQRLLLCSAWVLCLSSSSQWLGGLGKSEMIPSDMHFRDRKGDVGDDGGRYCDCGKEDWLFFSECLNHRASIKSPNVSVQRTSTMV